MANSACTPSQSPALPPELRPRLVYSRKDVAYLLSLSLRSIDYKIATGAMRIRRHGGRVVIPHAELLRQAALDDNTPVVPKKVLAVQAA